MSGGHYYWVAVLRDGSEVQQLTDGQELSVESLRKQAQPVAMFHLIPTAEGVQHPYIILEVGEGEGWIKHVTKSDVSGVQPDGSELPITHYETDVLGLIPNEGGSRSRKPVRLFVLPDGAVRMTTAPEEEGHYAEKPPNYEGPYPHLIDRRYKLEK